MKTPKENRKDPSNRVGSDAMVRFERDQIVIHANRGIGTFENYRHGRTEAFVRFVGQPCGECVTVALLKPNTEVSRCA